MKENPHPSARHPESGSLSPVRSCIPCWSHTWGGCVLVQHAPHRCLCKSCSSPGAALPTLCLAHQTPVGPPSSGHSYISTAHDNNRPSSAVVSSNPDPTSNWLIFGATVPLCASSFSQAPGTSPTSLSSSLSLPHLPIQYGTSLPTCHPQSPKHMTLLLLK